MLTAPKLTGLSGNEIYCMRLKGFTPSGVVIDEAAALGAEEVVGIKTYIVELGSSLVEIFSVGTAIRKQPGMNVQTDSLPAQAIIRDKDTWLNGSSAFEIQSLRAGN